MKRSILSTDIAAMSKLELKCIFGGTDDEPVKTDPIKKEDTTTTTTTTTQEKRKRPITIEDRDVPL